jgi:deoxyribodipyrimidine photo-lyase
VLCGPADSAILTLAAAARAERVLWTRRYEGAASTLDQRVKAELRDRAVEAASFNGRLLREPWEVAKADGKPFGVFSAFWRKHEALGAPAPPRAAPVRLTSATWPSEGEARVSIDSLRLTPSKPDWSGELALGETPGEPGALAALSRFVAEAAEDYASRRSLLGGETTSRLSAHLRFGEISAPRAAATVAHVAARSGDGQGPAKYLGELGWRDFATSILFAHPDLATRPLRKEFDHFPYRDDEASFRAWSRGETGYPIVDAGMRELWRAGFMPNRVRMTAASFLVKHLLIDWRRGEEWFWDTLCDADPASNPLNWQWVAGSGVDAAPYFRIFNPVLQAEKFDPDGAYVRRWVPELAKLEASDIHAPWKAPTAALAKAGVVLGKTYPKPIVDHSFARARALAAFAGIRSEKGSR